MPKNSPKSERAVIAAILGALATLVGVFIYGNKSKKDERIQKSRANPEM